MRAGPRGRRRSTPLYACRTAAHGGRTGPGEPAGCQRRFSATRILRVQANRDAGIETLGKRTVRALESSCVARGAGTRCRARSGDAHCPSTAYMTIYGLHGVTHGAAKVLTVMSPEGTSRALLAIAADDDVVVSASPGHLTRYQEKRRGALARLIAVNGIAVLTKREWDAKKAELGDAIWR